MDVPISLLFFGQNDDTKSISQLTDLYSVLQDPAVLGALLLFRFMTKFGIDFNMPFKIALLEK